MKKVDKSKENIQKEFKEIRELFEKTAPEDRWFFHSMLTHGLVNEVSIAIEKGALVIPPHSSFDLEEFNKKIDFLDKMAKKIINDSKDNDEENEF